MAKKRTRYVCQACGAVYQKWSGKCDACNTWDTVVEEISEDSGNFSKLESEKEGHATSFEGLQYGSTQDIRKSSGIPELDRVLGGGLVAGSCILIGGDPGIGKSTLLLQAMAAMANQSIHCCYITGEESIAQVQLRASRLGLEAANVKLASLTSVADILASLKKEKPDVVVCDSIQTMFLESLESAPGTVAQVRSSAHELIQFAKQHNVALFLVGHVTKDGQIAGPKVLEHMVDTVLYFEGDKGTQFRIVRSIKNRYGPANEIGIFEMGSGGLKEVTNPSASFISGKAGEVSGSVIFAGVEGTRPFLVEIQALVSPSYMPSPRRNVVGWDVNRLSMILAVLQVRMGLKLADKEVYLNVVGGMRLSEPAADLAVAAAVISALADIPFPPGMVIFGEAGLSGEVRSVGQVALRLKEASKLGLKTAILPDAKGDAKGDASTGFILHKIKYIQDLRKFLAEGSAKTTSQRG